MTSNQCCQRHIDLRPEILLERMSERECDASETTVSPCSLDIPPSPEGRKQNWDIEYDITTYLCVVVNSFSAALSGRFRRGCRSQG